MTRFRTVRRVISIVEELALPVPSVRVVVERRIAQREAV